MDFLKFFTVLSTAPTCFFLGFLTLFHNPKKPVNQIFSLICFGLGTWSLTLFLYEFPLIFNSLIWLKITYVLIYLTIPLVLFFTFIFPYPQKKFQKAALLISFIYIIFSLWLLLFTNHFVVEVFTAQYGL